MASIFDTIEAGRQFQVNDRLTNLVSGLASQKDKAVQGRFLHHMLDRDELAAMYEADWLSGTIVDAIPDDMTREWRRWMGGKNQISAMEKAEHQFGVRQRVNQAMKLARCFGGSVILLGTGDLDPSLPLNLDTLPKGGLQYLHVLSRWEITASEINRDPLSPTFGEPTYYTLAAPTATPTGEAQQRSDEIQIHPTRVVRFLGQARLELSRAIDGWGLPVLQRVYDAVMNCASSSAALASVLQEAKIDVIKVPGLTEKAVDQGWRTKMLARFGLANQGKSINNMLLLDKEEDWEQKEVRLAQWPDVLTKFLDIAAGAANMPTTRLLGRSPGGLGSTGEGEIRHYYDTVSSRQEVELRPALERLDLALKRHALGANPPDLDYEFIPLWQMTAAENAAINLQRAETAQILQATGLVPFQALAVSVQSQFVESAAYPGLEKALETAPKATPPMQPDGAQVKNPAVTTKRAAAPGDE